MARQKSIIKLQGTIDDISFVKTQDGYMARKATSVNGARIASDPAFQRTRENNSEFGRAGSASKLLRTAFRLQIMAAKDRRVVSRLVKEMMKVIKADATSTRGLRNVVDGEAEMLQYFEFNVNAQLSTTLFATYTPSFDRPTGAVAVAIPAFVPLTGIVAPEGATHFKIVAAASEIDFEAKTFLTAMADTGNLPIGSIPTAAISLAMEVKPASVHPIFLVLGIQFSQLVNGVEYPLKNGAFNALSIALVSGV
jgi:hypothetical protein